MWPRWVEQPRFRAGLDFLRLRGDAGEIDAELANWWEDFSLADDAGRRALLDAARTQGAPRRARARRPRAASASDTASDAPEQEADETVVVATEGDAPRKRRRRRRKPAADTGESAAPADVNPSNPSRDF